MSDLPPEELRDRAARAAFDKFSGTVGFGAAVVDNFFQKEADRWRVVVDAVAEVLAGHVGCEHLDGPYRRLVVERDDLRARVEQLSTMLRGMARRATDRQRRRRSAEGREHDVRLKRKLVLNRLGLALGVPFKSPSWAEYAQFEDKLCAAALRLRADQADQVVRLRVRAECAEADLAHARNLASEVLHLMRFRLDGRPVSIGEAHTLIAWSRGVLASGPAGAAHTEEVDW